MKHYKCYLFLLLFTATLTSCMKKDHVCSCADTAFCGTPYNMEIKNKTRSEAKAECSSYNIDPAQSESGIGRECQLK